ncbi:MAG: Na+/H+ antiporter subunit D [Bacteroidia bacterium]|nr:Na+/H+ antiporter subunit D [Bacteroidia bacterium]
MMLMLPILLPLAGAALSSLLRARMLAQHIIAGVVTAGMLLVSVLLLHRVQSEGIQVLQVGGWDPPFGITLVADTFSALMLLLTALLGFAVTVYSFAGIDEQRKQHGYFRLLLVLLMGVSGAFLTGDLFNLYVWFEVMLIASFVLMVLGSERAQLEGAIKYVTMNLLASVLFLIGIGVLYGKTGSLNFADLAVRLSSNPQGALVNVSAVLFLIAFGIKAAVFPFFFWLPDSYHVPPPAVTAIFSGLLTKVGIYATLRTFSTIFVHDQGFTQPYFLIVAGLTMVIGVLGAVAQGEMRRLLSFHIISQIGYAMMGIGIFTGAALSGVLYFTLHVAIAKAGLFLVAGYILAVHGSTTLKDLGGLLRSSPFVAILFLILALALAGLPPLSGFFAKYALIQAGLEAGSYVIVATALAVSVLTLFSMTKIWGEAFWRERDGDAAPSAGARTLRRGDSWLLIAPIVLLALCTVAMGVGAQYVFDLTDQAARELIDPARYIHTIRGALP